MENWELHEYECVNYLRENYENDYVSFVQEGESDSTVSDIKVEYNNGSAEDFYIESKMPVSQAGQFVLIADWTTNTFIYSPRNKHSENDASRKITEYMNDHFEYFANAGTGGVDVNVDNTLCYEWVMNHYKDLGAQYFITKVKDEFIISSVDNMPEYYDVSAKYRVKKSGSSDLSQKNISDLRNTLRRNGINDGTIEYVGGKAFVSTSRNVDYQKLAGDDYTYYFKPEGIRYYVRKLSNTANANVIFSVSIKSMQQDRDIDSFKRKIER